MITIAVQCHNFQRRFCWMLSSLVQQTRPDLIHVDVAHMRGNGKPSTEDLHKLFGPRLGGFTRSWWRRFEEFQKRGATRTRQLRECKAEWIMFGDCDMVYHPEYFERLHAELDKYPGAKNMFSSGRTSNDKVICEQLVNEHVTDTAVEVINPFGLVDKLEKKYPAAGKDWGRPVNVGAGFCQIINVKHCPHGGYYVGECNRDFAWDSRFNNPRSDVQFRGRIYKAGGPRVALPEWFGHNAIHLNHDRDPEVGHHITAQR